MLSRYDIYHEFTMPDDGSTWKVKGLPVCTKFHGSPHSSWDFSLKTTNGNLRMELDKRLSWDLSLCWKLHQAVEQTGFKAKSVIYPKHVSKTAKDTLGSLTIEKKKVN